MPIIADLSELLLQLGLSATCTETERAIAQAALRSATSAVVRHLKYNPVQSTHTEYYPQMDMGRQGREGIWEANDTEAYIRHVSEASTNELQIKNIPIRSITSLYVDYDGRSGTRTGSFAAETLKVAGSDYWANFDLVDSAGNKVCTDGIIRAQGTWPDLAGSVKITYVAGYTATELRGEDTVIDAGLIFEAVIDEAVRRVLKIYSRSKNRLAGFVGPLTSENLGDYSYSSSSGIFDRLVGGQMDILPETELKLADFCRYDLGVM